MSILIFDHTNMKTDPSVSSSCSWMKTDPSVSSRSWMEKLQDIRTCVDAKALGDIEILETYGARLQNGFLLTETMKEIRKFDKTSYENAKGAQSCWYGNCQPCAECDAASRQWPYGGDGRSFLRQDTVMGNGLLHG